MATAIAVKSVKEFMMNAFGYETDVNEIASGLDIIGAGENIEAG